MAPFEDLQRLWQRQPPHAVPLNDAADLTRAFRRYGRRHDLIYLAKGAVIALQLAIILPILRHNPLAAFGFCLADFSATLFVVADWRKQHAIARLNFAAPSVEFLRGAIARLEAQRYPFRNRHFSIALGGYAVGLGLWLASVWHLFTPTQAGLALVLIAVAPLGAYTQGVRIRRKRFEKQCRPLIIRLEAVLHTMEADQL